MKPINTRELNKAYRTFAIYFLSLLLFALLCVFCFFATSNKEMDLLSQQAKQYDKLIYTRQEITSQFDFILMRMQALAQYVNGNAQELNDQSVLMTAIQSGNQRVKGLLDDIPDNVQGPSFDVYRTMTNNIRILSGLKDSLAQTRFQIESLRSQLDNCNGANKKLTKILNGGL